jgi:hypothetical protein
MAKKSAEKILSGSQLVIATAEKIAQEKLIETSGFPN